MVVGDVVLLSTGDKVPADGIIVSGNLSVDESSINGETSEVYKYSNDNEHNYVFKGTVVYSGDAVMLVKAVGDNTFYGEIALELQENQPESPLKLRLRDLAQSISKLGYLGAILVSFSYLFNVIVIDNHFVLSSIVSTFWSFIFVIKSPVLSPASDPRNFPFISYSPTTITPFDLISIPMFSPPGII